MRGHRHTPIQKGGGKGQCGRSLSGQKEVYLLGLVTPAPRTCRAAAATALLPPPAPPPGLGPSKHSRPAAGIFIPRSGRGSSAHHSPCPARPPRPAPGQRGTSRRGDTPQMQPPLSTEASGRVARDAGGFPGDTPCPSCPGNTSTECRPAGHTATPPKTQNTSKITWCKQRDPHHSSHARVTSPHAGRQNANTICAWSGGRQSRRGHTHKHTRRMTASVLETHPTDTTCSE